MNTSSRFLVGLLLLPLLGAGCLGGSSDTSERDGGLWQSSDAGRTWTQLSALPTKTGVSSIGPANVTTFAIDPSDNEAFYLGTTGSGLVFSYDAGSTWQRPKEELAASGKIVGVAVDPRDVCTYYVAKSERVLKTTTCGRMWNTESYVESRAGESLTSLTIDWYNPGIVYLTTTAGDLIRSTDSGTTWSTIYRANDEVMAFAVGRGDSRILLVGTERHGIVRSVDGGATWVEMEDAMTDLYKDSDKVYDFSQTDNGDTLYVSSGYGLLVSSDSGATWQDVPLITARGEVDILALAVDPNNGDNVYYGTDSTLYHSTSGGDAWTTVKLPSSRATSTLMVHPENGNVLLLGVAAIED